MKNDEFAFFNQQLAAMVRDGIPLETGLRRLCADMRRGKMRDQLEKLEADLAKGAPLRDAVQARQLPDLYKQMLEVGAKSNNLPGVLTLLADYYQRRHVVWTRLKGLMMYPAIVLFGTFLLACFAAVILDRLAKGIFFPWVGYGYEQPVIFGVWFAPIILGLAVLAMFFALSMPGARRFLRWRLPAFKEASLAQTASAMALMLKSGVPLDNALGLIQQLEWATPAEPELARWRQRLAAGRGKFSEMAEGGKLFPPLFLWTVSQSHEDLTTGFQRAAEVFQARASYQIELLLYSAMPCAILALGVVIVTEIQPVLSVFAAFTRALSN